MPLSPSHLFLSALGIALATACTSPTGLSVDVKTDYAPVEQFASLRTEIATTRFASAEPSGQVTSRAVRSGEAFLTGVRAAEQDGITVGEYFVRVSLVAPSGVVIASRVTQLQVSHTGRYSVTAILSRSCEGVRCPGVGDAASATECDRGTCVDPSCSSAQPERCAPPECLRDADCTGPLAHAECARAACVDGACFYSADEARCGIGAHCRASDLACIPVLPVDAATTDASTPVDAPLVCDADHGNCDGDDRNGCETDLRATPVHCGACNTTRPEICDGADNSCDGAIDEGCRIPVHRAVRTSPGIAYRFTSDVARLSTDGYAPEAMNVYYVYPPSGPGSDGVYDCQWTTGGTLTTRSPTCEDHPETGTITMIGRAFAPEFVGDPAARGCANVSVWWRFNPGFAPSFYHSLSPTDAPSVGTDWTATGDTSGSHVFCVWSTPGP